MAKIIVIDDSRIARTRIANALRGEADVVEAVDGEDGLAKIRANPDAGLVVCDVNMPNLTGVDLLALVREEPAPIAAVPFLLVTSEADAGVIRRAKELGARGWLVKPIEPEVLCATARRLLR